MVSAGFGDELTYPIPPKSGCKSGPVTTRQKIRVTIERLNHLHLKTPDPRKTADFYVNYVGAKIVSERRAPDGRVSFRLNLHGVELSVTDFLDEQKLAQFYGLEHVAIDTDNFAGEVANIKAAGINILEERVLPDGRKVCFFEGPEGVRLEFLEMR